MPINNYLYGVYKIATIFTNKSGVTFQYPYIIESLTDKVNMDTSAKEFMQGDPRNRVLDIKAIRQDISVRAPILVPVNGATVQDGLALMNDILNLQYTYSGTGWLPTNYLPVLTSLSLDINEDESKVSFELKSDGNPLNAAGVYVINSGTTAQGYITQTGLNNAARIAKNYDFAVNLGGINLLVKKLNLKIDVAIKENNFLGSANYAVPSYGGNPANLDIIPNGFADPNQLSGLDGSYTGWQFPFLSVGAIKMTIDGTASISIDNSGNTINYPGGLTPTTRQQLFQYIYGNSAQIHPGFVSFQNDGVFNYNSNSLGVFALNVDYTPVSILPNVLSQFNDAIVNSSNYNFTANEMTFDFNATAFPGA